MKLIDALTDYRDRDIYPMHMPGHKRNTSLLTFPLPYGIDITEIEGFDNLHNAKGLLAKGMARAAGLYGSRHSFYLINGSTCGILAGVFACAKKADKILMARNCHKAVYNAVALRELQPVYLMPEIDESFGIAASISPLLAEAALKEHEDIRAIIITSPTYEGVVSDIPAIAKLAHDRGIPLIVDEAHGAHLGFGEYFPENSVKSGADIVIHSLHKTLPAFTQSALLHVNGDLVDPKEVEIQLRVFESSSPSYILMAGIDNCIDLLYRRKDELFNNYTQMLKGFSQKMAALKKLRVLFMGVKEPHPKIFAFDPGKIVISVKNTNISGVQLKNLLLSRYKIELEMSMGDYALAMTSICDTNEGFNRLAEALLEIDAEILINPKAENDYNLPFLPEAAMASYKAQGKKGSFVNLKESLGGICLEYVYAYPPGIPILVPGEIISPKVLESLGGLIEKGVFLNSTYGRLPQEIKLAT